MSTLRKGGLDSAKAAEQDGYVLPQRRRGPSSLVVSATGPLAQRLREAEVARSLGERSMALLECQERFLGELRSSLEEFENDLGEATAAQLQGRVRSALSVLDWCDAVQDDLRQESQLASRGLQPIDLLGFCRDAAGVAAASGLTVDVYGERDQPWWGDAALLGEAVEAAVALVRARAGDGATIVLEIQDRGAEAALRIAGLGGPAEEVDADLIDRFRGATARLGGRVTPDALGPGGAGLVLQLPARLP